MYYSRRLEAAVRVAKEAAGLPWQPLLDQLVEGQIQTREGARLNLEEEVVVLPLPEWADAPYDTYAGVASLAYFRSDAERMAADFAKELAEFVKK